MGIYIIIGFNYCQLDYGGIECRRWKVDKGGYTIDLRIADDDEKRVRKVRELITSYGLDAEVIWHREKAVLSLEDALEVHCVSPGNVLKCLLMKDREGTVIGVMAPGDVRIDVKKLEKQAGARKLRFMSGEEMMERLCVEPGGVDPLTLPQRVEKVFIERSLLEKKALIGSAGSKHCGLKIKPSEILKIVNATVLDIAER